MTNFEQIKSMSENEIADKLCNLVSIMAENAELIYACAICPVEKICQKGCNGFKKFFSLEAKTEGG